MSAESAASDGEDDGDFLDPIREHEEEVEGLASESGQVGAAARVLLALANNKQPSEADLKTSGFVRDHGEEGSSW